MADKTPDPLMMMNREIGQHNESLRGLWAVVRELRADINHMPAVMDEKIDHHNDDCVARAKIWRKATSDSDDNIPISEVSQVFDLQRAEIERAQKKSLDVKTMIMIAVVIAATLIAGGIFIGVAWVGGAERTGEVIRDISGK